MELFRNFKPPGWERVDERPAVTESTVVKARWPREDSSDWAEEWLRGGENAGAGEGEEEDGEEGKQADVAVLKTYLTAGGTLAYCHERARSGIAHSLLSYRFGF